jgi:hypothetical protein
MSVDLLPDPFRRIGRFPQLAHPGSRVKGSIAETRTDDSVPNPVVPTSLCQSEPDKVFDLLPLTNETAQSHPDATES